MTRISIAQAADALSISKRAARRLCELEIIGLAVGKERKTYIVWQEKVDKLKGV